MGKKSKRIEKAKREIDKIFDGIVAEEKRYIDDQGFILFVRIKRELHAIVDSR